MNRNDGWVVVAAPALVAVLLVWPMARLAFIVLAGIVVLGPPEFTSANDLSVGGVLVSAFASSQRGIREGPGLPREVDALLVSSRVGHVLLAGVAAVRCGHGFEVHLAIRAVGERKFPRQTLA